MDATQVIDDSILESDEEESEEEGRPPLAKLCILKNPHIPETELPLFLGNNVLGRDPGTCTVPFPASSVSKQHATICISVYRRRGCLMDMEALVWDLGSMNGTRKGRLKLTPNVRYALSEGDSLVVADIPCQYVSCATDLFPSRDGMRTPGSRNSGAKARWPHALVENLGDTSTGSKKCVNSSAKAEMSLKETPVRGSCLSFEQTPAQPQGTLVPESDSDSDSERWEGGDKKQKTLVSNSDSHKSTSDSSVFLSPANRTVPESDSESPIMPSSSNRNGPSKHVSFNIEESDVDVGQQQLEKENPPVIGEEEDEGAAEGRVNSKESEQHVEIQSSTSLTRDVESFVSTPEVSRKDIPAFHMDSDTDVEEEEEEKVSAGPPNTALFHMDSDTDVDEDKDTSEVAPRSNSSSTDTKPSHVASVIQPEDITMDSDTDAEEDDTALSDAANAEALQSAHAADSASSVLPRDFHPDSDTDVDEEAEGGCGAGNQAPKYDIKLAVPESAPAAPHDLHADSDTDDEVVPREPSAANAGAYLDILSDSDTDMEDDSPPAGPVAVTNLSGLPGTTSEAPKSDSDADTDVDESSLLSAGKKANLAGFTMDSDSDAEGQGLDNGKAAEDQMPDLQRENTPGFLVPLLQNCSTPVQVAGGGVDEMETQAFISPSSSAFRCPVASTVGPAALSSCSDSQEDEDFTVAETQSFLLRTSVDPTKVAAHEPSGLTANEESCREDSFQLGLSDSSHLQRNSGALATDSTQAFVSVEGGVNLEDTQAYAAANTASAGNDSNLEATQAYGEDAEPVRYSDKSKKDGCEDFALEATQAYILDPCNDSDDDSDGNKEQNAAVTETQPSGSTLATAETQPVSPYAGGESLEANSLHEAEGGDEEGKGRPPTESQSIPETQPICISNTDESDDEDLFPGSAKPLQRDEDQTQPLTGPLAETQPLHVSVDPTQPMVVCEDAESEEEESVLVPRKRKAEQHHFDVQLQNSEVSNAETQPLASCEDDDSELMPVQPKRKAQPLQIEDETQSLTDSAPAVEGRLSGTFEDRDSDEDDLTPRLKKRKAKALQFEDEQTQTLISSEVSESGTRPAATGEDEENVESVPGPRKSKAKQRHLEAEETQPAANSEVCASESPMKKEPARASEARTTRGMRERGRKDKEVSERSAAPKRQTRSEGKILTSTRGRRGKARSDDGSSDVEMKQTKGRRNTRQQEETGKERRETEEQERLKAEDAERLERERKEKEEELRLEKEREQKEKLEREKEEKQRLEKEREQKEKLERENEEKLRLEKEREQKEKLEREEKERLDRERREKLEKESLEIAKREQEERLEREAKEHQARLEREERERLQKEKESKAEEKPATPARGRRSVRRTIAAQPEQDFTPHSGDFPARRTRSHSNSSNSVSSERSASGVSAQESKGRGRGRGARSNGDAAARSSRRRTAAAAGQPEHDSNSTQELLTSNSVSSETLSCSGSTQSRGRGGRQRGRGRKTDTVPPAHQESGPVSAMRGINSNKEEESSNKTPREDDGEKPPAGTSRGQQRTSMAASKRGGSNDEGQSHQGEAADVKSPPPNRSVRGRGQKAEKADAVEDPEDPTVSNGEEVRNQSKGKKSESVANEETSSAKVSKGKERAKKTEAAEEEGKDEPREESPYAVRGRKAGRASGAQRKRSTKVSLPEKEMVDGEEMEGETAGKRARGRTSAVQKNKNEALDVRGTPAAPTNQDANVEASEPQTPTSGARRKRQAPPDSSPVAKTPRSCSASPSAGGQPRAGSRAYKVLFTGVVDEKGERVLARLGGSMAKGVSDMNYLVTDKVRRTVKFLCAVAKGIPVVTTDWLEKSGKAGSFLPPNSFIVKDPEHEKKFNFCLQESLRTASSQPLLQGYEIHVTKSVKPEPVYMKDIISSSGATFLPKMPSAHKAQTVVISCEEDWRLCGPAVSASLPVVTAEFILTGILQQKVDFKTHALSPPAADLQPAGGRGRGRKKN